MLLFQRQYLVAQTRSAKDGITVDLDKVKVIMEWSVPKNVSNMSSFMEITGYYKKFIEGFSKISYPITSLQRKKKSLSGLKSARKVLTN